MAIEPYKRPPKPRDVAWMTRSGKVRTEGGRTLSLGDVSPKVTIYSDWRRVQPLSRGWGEVGCWNDTPTTFLVDDRTVRIVPELPGTDDEHLEALVRLRDALASYGASGTSLASCSWSLLRATLERRVIVNGGPDPIHIPEVVGGRVVYGQSPGHFPRFVKIDISAAYASTLGAMSYPGQWVRFDQAIPPADEPMHYFYAGRVWVPKMTHGPLPKRLLRPPPHVARSPGPSDIVRKMSWLRPYPTGGLYLRGLWSGPELRAAMSVGVDPKPDRGWIMVGGDPDWKPFAPWWTAIQVLRSLDGMAGTLGKVVGNTLVGRFQARGAHWRLAWDKDSNCRYRRRVNGWHPPRSSQPLDIAELVCSTVRARLYTEAIVPAGDRLIGAHTDGALLTEPIPLQGGWRTQHEGSGLIFLSPQTWAYPDADGRWIYTYSGVPADKAADAFAQLARAQLGRGWRSGHRRPEREEVWQATFADAV